jgi:hypothetical protein
LALTVLAMATGCAISLNPQTHARARQQVLARKTCPQKQIVHEDPQTLTFVLTGCGQVVRVGMICEDGDCIEGFVSVTNWQVPKRLLTTDQKVWRAPGAPAPTPATTGDQPAKPVENAKPGRRLTSMDDPKHRPSLPPELNHTNIVVWGLFTVCVDNHGVVEAVEVVKSSLPGGMDGDWISNIELWQYLPAQVDGRPVSFCGPVRLQVEQTL